MRRTILFSLACFWMVLVSGNHDAAARPRHPAPAPAPPPVEQGPRPKWALLIHGGAGDIDRSKMDPKLEAQYRAALAGGLNRGAEILKAGGSARDAVEAVIRGFEEESLFNAGKGSVFTSSGKIELDAAFMDGGTLRDGAVAGLTRTKHPISAARQLMEHSANVMLIGPGADAFAAAHGVEQADEAYFFTERRWQALKAALRAQGKSMPPRPDGVGPEPGPGALSELLPEDHKYGTVGAVALDELGHVAAGTSTGGTTAKPPGRVGDSPIIGAGTYASDASCAVSATGTGEYFIRLTAARDICALVQYQHMPLQQAVDEVMRRVSALGGDGGVIAVTPDGQVAWKFNTTGMYRGRLVEGGTPIVSIYNDEL